MKTYKEYLNEAGPVGWKPTPRAAAGAFASALEKIVKNNGQMPFDGNFTGTDTIRIRFGLDPEEFTALQKSGLMVRSELGWNIDRNKFIHARANLSTNKIK